MKCKLSDIAYFNPLESIKKGIIAKKVTMDKLQPFCRDITGYELTEFNGGTKFRNGDTIMARITPCLENGKTAKVNILNDGEVGFGSTEYIVFRAKENIADEDFIYYLVCSSIVRDPAIKSMVGSSGRQRVQLDVVQNLEINLPNLETQKKIASILKALDDKIALNQKINENLEKQIFTYYNFLFVKNKNKSWKLGTISDLGKIVGGGTPSKNHPEYYSDKGISWITPKDLSVNNNKFISKGANDITKLGLSKSNAVLMPKGTVLFSSRAPIGYIAISDCEITTNQGFKSIIPYENIGSSFVYCFLKKNLEYIETYSSGSTFKEISGGILKQIPITIPDDLTLLKFNNFSSLLLKYQKNNEKQNKRLATLRDTLLPKLMSGGIDLSKI